MPQPQSPQQPNPQTGMPGTPPPGAIPNPSTLDKAPAFPPLRDIPLTTVPYWSTVNLVDSALDTLERGYFQQAAFLVDAMGRDDRIAACDSTRVNALVGLDLQIDAPDGEDASNQQQDVRDEVERDFWRWASQAEIGKLLHWGLFLGVSFAEIVWDTKRVAGRWVPRLKIWHPQFVYWRWDTRSYWVTTMDGLREVTPGDGHWIVYEPYGQFGWLGKALVRPLAHLWIFRNYDRNDWARYNEVHGMPIRLAKVPSEANQQVKQRFLQLLRNLGREAVIEAQAGKDWQYGMELVEAKADTYETFKDALSGINEDIAVTVLGQNLTTEVHGGSLAAARVHENVRRDYLKADATTLSECLSEQMLKPWARFNFGDAGLAPRVGWNVDPPEDLAQKATALQSLSQALVNFSTAGAPVDQRAMLEDFGIEQSEEDATPPAPTAAQPPIQQPSPPETPKPEEEKPAALARVKLGRQHKVLRAHHAAKAGQKYADRLTDKLQKVGANAFAPDLHILRRAIDSATSHADLRERLKHAFHEMSASELEAKVGRAMVLAELAGRRAVLEGM